MIIGRNGVGKTAVLDVLAVLRDFAVRGVPLEGYLGGKTRTRWQDVAERQFELDVKGNGGEYRYTLVVDEKGSPPRPHVKQEILDFSGKPLFRFQEGKIGLFNDQQKPTPSVEFPFDWRRPGLATVQIGRKDNTKLTWFKRWLGGLVEIQINPWAMSAMSEREAPDPAKDMGNFADWYRHLRLERGNAIFEAMANLRDAIPGLDALDAKEAGLDMRVHHVIRQARGPAPPGQPREMTGTEPTRKLAPPEHEANARGSVFHSPSEAGSRALPARRGAVDQRKGGNTTEHNRHHREVIP